MVLIVVDDLLFSSKIRAAASAAKTTTVTARTREAVIELLGDESPSLVIIDLDSRPAEALETIRLVRETSGAGPRIVGYGAHVNVDRLRAAIDAGCDEAVPRSVFVTMLPGLFTAPVAGPC